MKFLHSIILIFFLCVSCLEAQSDMMLIKLKSAQTDTIAIYQIHMIQFENVTGVSEENTASINLFVMGNNPNPFTESTIIEFEISTSGDVEIDIYDYSGNLIQILQCKNCQSGKKSLTWNCLDMNNKRVQSGMYFYEVRFKDEIHSKKMFLVK